MNLKLVEKIADAVLYEGYLLYPYRPSSVKNQQRFNFGVLVPQSYSEAQTPGTESWRMQTECLVLANSNATLDVKVRFLHLRERRSNETSWQEAVEREVSGSNLPISQLIWQPHCIPIFYPSTQEDEFMGDAYGSVTDQVARSQVAIKGAIELRVTACKSEQVAPERLFKITARIVNQTAFENAAIKTRDEALMHSLVSAHTILAVRNGEFVSLLDPPEEFRETAAACNNIGAWPVLAGEEGERDVMLSSPIILYDYPQIAPESAGDLFDGTEIDEILLLRIMTLTDEEKREMQATDDRARKILDRTERLPEKEWMKLHGVLRELRPMNR